MSRTSKVPNERTGRKTVEEPTSEVTEQPLKKTLSTDPLYISDDGKNGLITAIGIVLAFTLSFVGQWSLEPGAWQPADGPPATLLLLGIVVQVGALLGALLPYKQTIQHYKRVVFTFVAGILIITLRIAVAVASA